MYLKRKMLWENGHMAQRSLPFLLLHDVTVCADVIHVTCTSLWRAFPSWMLWSCEFVSLSPLSVPSRGWSLSPCSNLRELMIRRKRDQVDQIMAAASKKQQLSGEQLIWETFPDLRRTWPPAWLPRALLGGSKNAALHNLESRASEIPSPF